MIPDISYIVSAYNRPDVLPVCLYSLKIQTHKNFEVIVTDNATDKRVAAEHKRIVEQVNRGDGRFRYLATKERDCYWSAEKGARVARGAWLCFPCDDVYYVPHFGQKMLGTAVLNQWEFVVSGAAILGPDSCGAQQYLVWKLGSPLFPTGKSEFLIRSDKFKGFPGKAPGTVSVNCDRVLGQELMFGKHKLPWGIVDECLVVHN